MTAETGGEGAAGGLESSELLGRLYAELRRLAQRRIGAERAGHTLQATALVHEAYLRLTADEAVRWDSDRHFFGAAAEAMRRVLVDHARGRGRIKRGGPEVDRRRISLTELDAADGLDQLELLAVDEALDLLETEAPDVGEIVRLRFFGGLTVERVAALTGKSERTVKRDWAWARARLYRALEGDEESSAE